MLENFQDEYLLNMICTSYSSVSAKSNDHSVSSFLVQECRMCEAFILQFSLAATDRQQGR